MRKATTILILIAAMSACKKDDATPSWTKTEYPAQYGKIGFYCDNPLVNVMVIRVSGTGGAFISNNWTKYHPAGSAPPTCNDIQVSDYPANTLITYTGTNYYDSSQVFKGSVKVAPNECKVVQVR